MSIAQKVGQAGEAVAFDYLRQQHFSILDTNWRIGHLELDLVCSDGETLVVVEVKTRKEHSLTSPLSAITAAKRRTTAQAADLYARTKGVRLPIRFDVITVVAREDGSFAVEHIPNAFLTPQKRRLYRRR